LGAKHRAPTIETIVPVTFYEIINGYELEKGKECTGLDIFPQRCRMVRKIFLQLPR
jgi:hypothetical protein